MRSAIVMEKIPERNTKGPLVVWKNYSGGGSELLWNGFTIMAYHNDIGISNVF